MKKQAQRGHPASSKWQCLPWNQGFLKRSAACLLLPFVGLCFLQDAFLTVNGEVSDAGDTRLLKGLSASHKHMLYGLHTVHKFKLVASISNIESFQIEAIVSILGMADLAEQLALYAVTVAWAE